MNRMDEMFASVKKGTLRGASDNWLSACCSCRMRRERLIKPTKHLYSICCNDRAGQISVAHLAILRLPLSFTAPY